MGVKFLEYSPAVDIKPVCETDIVELHFPSRRWQIDGILLLGDRRLGVEDLQYPFARGEGVGDGVGHEAGHPDWAGHHRQVDHKLGKLAGGQPSTDDAPAAVPDHQRGEEGEQQGVERGVNRLGPAGPEGLIRHGAGRVTKFLFLKRLGSEGLDDPDARQVLLQHRGQASIVDLKVSPHQHQLPCNADGQKEGHGHGCHRQQRQSPVNSQH